MKAHVRLKYILFIALFAVFVFARVAYNIATNSITETDFQGLALSSASFPFGIIKETATNSHFMPLYYVFIHFFKNVTLLRIINAFIAFLTIGIMFLIGRKIKSKALGYFLAFFLSVNHFFILYTNQISPYCFNFLIISLLIYSLLCFLKKQTKLNFLFLAIFNCAFILCDNFGFVFVGCELLVFYLICAKTKYLKQATKKLFMYSLVSFLVVSPILIAQFYHFVIKLFSSSPYGVGLNMTSLYLLICDYFSPFLSFDVPDFQTKSNIGMLYSCVKTLNMSNINTIKLLTTLFYSSLLPFCLMVFFTFKTVSKNYIFKILFYISILNFTFFVLLMLYQTIDVKPIYVYPFFFVCLIFLGYGIFQIKDVILRGFIVACLLLIQVIEPKLNSFDIVVNRQNATINALNQFIEQYQITSGDLIIMPYLNKYAGLYYKGLNFVDFDYSDLNTNSKKGLIRGFLAGKNEKINKYNIKYYIDDFLLNIAPNDFVREYFNEICSNRLYNYKRVILFIDKLNTKPYSNSEIASIVSNNNYSTGYRKINFKKNILQQNPSQELFNCVKSRFLYDIIFMLEEKLVLNNIVEYKKIDTRYYDIDTKSSLMKVLNNNKSDYAFFVFKK